MNQYVLRKDFDRTGRVASRLASAFGRRVAQRRMDLVMTQEAMIQRVNAILNEKLGRTTASVWENGHAEPSMTTIAALAQVLHTRPEYLAYGVSGSVRVLEAPSERKLRAPDVPAPRRLSRREPVL
jgi:transcriptional regulator with XRE-family HTH domain